MRQSLIPLALLLAGVASTAAHASPVLLAVGTLDASGGDLSTATAAALENGVAGNLLGGIGSGLAWAGGNTFLALPDRGPNATSYNALIDDTSSYIPRFQTVTLTLTANPVGSTLPYSLTPTLSATTLLSSSTPLVYGSGAGLGVGSGAPALNAVDNTYYFSGRSDNFDASASSTNPDNARLDPESIRVSNDGKSVFISDEYGPYVYQFDRASGERIRTYTLPDRFAATTLSAQGDVEISANSSGRVANKGMEGLALTPDGKTLVGIMQSPLLQDGGTAADTVRIVTIDVETGATKEYAYKLTNIGTAAAPKYPTVSEIVAINDHEFIIDERDGKGLGDDSKAKYKMLYRIDLDGATEVSAITDQAALAAAAVGKTEFLDVKTALADYFGSDKLVPAKIEGLAFGADMLIDGVLMHTLYVANDNDFLSEVDDPLGSGGTIANPNQFFVFGIAATADDGFVSQAFIPEPGSVALFGLGLAGLAARRRRR
ncbi:esterase-like activity of phytase family protein [Plasticicumulans acidivorans]|uniref:Putative secreted protein with PEP-CTERM sorting signal n=1 Tax=Plasticicumulans acidivorans TaxID=886464 RepID=A0A317N4F1_9GAMM|nr:esterase-like activity of phytase family protein [Plasticicumulans acidivorans]PWV65639.1 putative secreted protein with PEP-CTERM sorting signal [Plasticicumulans acidivorans]